MAKTTFQPRSINSPAVTQSRTAGQVASGYGSGGSGVSAYASYADVSAAAINAISSGVSAYYNAKAEKAVAQAQARLSAIQANSLDTAADDVMRNGQRAAASVGAQYGALKSSTRTAQAGAGIRVGSAGSAAESLATIDVAKEMKVADALDQAITKAQGLRRQSFNARWQSAAYSLAAKSISPWIGAVSAIGASVAGTAEKFTARISDSSSSSDSKQATGNGEHVEIWQPPSSESPAAYYNAAVKEADSYKPEVIPIPDYF